MKKLVGATLLFAVAVGLAGCSQSHKTGGKDTLNFKESTSTTAAPTTTAAPQQTTVAPAHAKATPTTAAAKVSTFTITIHPDGDASGTQFDPADAHVAVGTAVTWVNGDSVNRSVVATDGKFTSPMIPPGGSWSYTVTAAGTYNYKDGTRPYALGKFTAG